MKKQFLLSILLLFVLVGCEEESSPEDTQENNHIVFDVGSHNGEDIDSAQYADITFTNYTYSPFTKKLCFNITINDSKYFTSQYILVERLEDNLEPLKEYTFKIDSDEAFLHHCQAFSPGNEMAIGKVNTMTHHDSDTVDALAWLTMEIEEFNQRDWTGGTQLNVVELESYQIGQFAQEEKIYSPYIVLDFTSMDPKRLIDGVYIELYYRDFDLVYETLEIEIIEEMYEGEHLELENIVMDKLPPDVEFDVYYYIKGSDSVDDYNYILSGIRKATSTTTGFHSWVKNAYPGLWADITGYEIGEETTTVSYRFINNQNVTYNDQPVSLALTTVNDAFVVHLDPYEESVEVDSSFINPNDPLQIIVYENGEVLTQLNVD